MRDAESTYVLAAPGSPLQELAGRHLERDDALERQGELGHYHEHFEHVVAIETAAGQLRLELTDYDRRANVRAELARYLDRIVLPGTYEPKIRALPEKLRQARRKCWFQLDTESGNTRTLWEHKAGEPLLCPDDAREEAMRLQRRLEGSIVELYRRGYRVYFGVLTIDNAAPGELAPRIASLWKKFRRALKARVPNKPGERIARKKRAPLFPIVGAIATLEAPLSASRTWHPHLNVIAITRGFFDFGAWWKHWNCVSDWQPIKGSPESVAAAFRELIKYSVRAVPEKSAAKAACASSAAPGADDPLSGHRPPAPAMTEWTRPEFLEWWAAMKGRRRTRTYGELFGLNVEPEAEEGASWITIGSAQHDGTRFRAWIPLLESIPGDKSIPNPLDRVRKWNEDRTGPPEFWAQEHARIVAGLQADQFQQMKETEGRR